MSKEKLKQKFIEKGKLVHNNKYDYSKVEYTDNKTKVCIICHEKDDFGEEHGEFWQIPGDHINKRCGCPKCKGVFRYNTKTFIEKASKIHNNFYNYEKTTYVNNKTPIVIICPQHGEFIQIPQDHLKGHGCPKCGQQQISESKFIGTQQFIKKAKQIHKNKYNYKLVDYKGCNEKVTIICPIHGKFEQKPANHLQGQGCPKCNQSKGEQNIKKYLELNNIKYIDQYEIQIDKSINPSGIAKIDFYLPDYDLYIEYNGIQHYIPIEYFGGKLKFDIQQKRDQYIRNYCGNKLVEIKYTDQMNINNILNNVLNNKK